MSECGGNCFVNLIIILRRALLLFSWVILADLPSIYLDCLMAYCLGTLVAVVTVRDEEVLFFVLLLVEAFVAGSLDRGHL